MSTKCKLKDTTGTDARKDAGACRTLWRASAPLWVRQDNRKFDEMPEQLPKTETDVRKMKRRNDAVGRPLQQPHQGSNFTRVHRNQAKLFVCNDSEMMGRWPGHLAGLPASNPASSHKH